MLQGNTATLQQDGLPPAADQSAAPNADDPARIAEDAEGDASDAVLEAWNSGSFSGLNPLFNTRTSFHAKQPMG